MPSPIAESDSISFYLGLDEVDYGSDTSVHDGKRTMSDTPMHEEQPLMATVPLSELSDVNVPLAQHPAFSSDDAIITNPLDEQQQLIVQQEESAQRTAQMVATLQS